MGGFMLFIELQTLILLKNRMVLAVSTAPVLVSRSPLWVQLIFPLYLIMGHAGQLNNTD
jgi:hypothetical protein